MMELEDVYSYLIGKLTELIVSEQVKDIGEIKSQLRSIAREAELMHCYIGFREENKKLEAQGLPAMDVEEEFSGTDVELVRYYMEHENMR